MIFGYFFFFVMVMVPAGMERNCYLSDGAPEYCVKYRARKAAKEQKEKPAALPPAAAIGSSKVGEPIKGR